MPAELIENKIFVIRGLKVMLDRDLARLYKVSTKVFKQTIRRNADRFPKDFMFQLTKDELANWRSQFVTSNSDKMGLRHQPFAFTEHGVAMLSSVLKSEEAIAINIQIIRTFITLRDLATSNSDLNHKIEFLEKHYNDQFKIVFDALRKVLTIEEDQKPEIGYKINRKK